MPGTIIFLMLNAAVIHCSLNIVFATGGKEKSRKFSGFEKDDVPGLKGRALKLPSHLTYRTTADEMHDNLGM